MNATRKRRLATNESGVKRARTLVAPGPMEMLSNVAKKWRVFVSGEVEVDKTYEKVFEECQTLSGLTNDNARNRWRRFIVKRKSAFDSGEYTDPELPGRVPDMTREQCLAHYTLIIILSYKLAQIDASKIAQGRISMSHKWQVGVYVIMIALGRVQLNELDPTSEASLSTMDDRYREMVSTAADLCCLRDESGEAVVEHVMDIVRDFVQLQNVFLNNLSTVTALNLGTNTCMADIPSWETVDVGSTTARGLVMCDISGSYFPAPDVLTITVKTFNGATRVFNGHKDLVVFVQVAHIHLTMGKTIALNPGHMQVSINEWVETVTATYSACLTNFCVLFLATTTRLNIEENFDLISVP